MNHDYAAPVRRDDNGYSIIYTAPLPYFILDGKSCYYPSDLEFGETYSAYLFVFSPKDNDDLTDDDVVFTVGVPLYDMEAYDELLMSDTILYYLLNEGIITNELNGLYVQTPVKPITFKMVPADDESEEVFIEIVEEDGNTFTL